LTSNTVGRSTPKVRVNFTIMVYDKKPFDYDNIIQYAIATLNSLPQLPLGIGSVSNTVFIDLANILALDKAMIRRELEVNSKFKTGFSIFVAQLFAIVGNYSSYLSNVTLDPSSRQLIHCCYWPVSPTGEASPELLEKEVQDASVDYCIIINLLR
jgi:hypothetical protein